MYCCTVQSVYTARCIANPISQSTSSLRSCWIVHTRYTKAAILRGSEYTFCFRWCFTNTQIKCSSDVAVLFAAHAVALARAAAHHQPLEAMGLYDLYAYGPGTTLSVHVRATTSVASYCIPGRRVWRRRHVRLNVGGSRRTSETISEQKLDRATLLVPPSVLVHRTMPTSCLCYCVLKVSITAAGRIGWI